MKELDPILHNQLRLAIMSLCITHEEASFSFIVEKTDASRGNVSIQISTLEEAGYVAVTKTFKNKKPHTSLKITPKGIDAMDRYTEALKGYLNL